MREINLVSSRLASGVTFLTNILLELNIKTIFGPDKSHSFWEETGGQYTIKNDDSYYFYRLYTPAFEKKRTFPFDKGLEVYFSHFYEACIYNRPTILFVRDPRDAIYSLYKRTNFSEKNDFKSYLTNILETSQTIRMTPVLEWVYFHEFYLEFAKSKQLLLIRFEDIKAEPEKYVKHILNFMDVSKTDSEISSAILNSSFEKAKKVMRSTEKITNQKSFNPIRRGKSFEWKEWMTSDFSSYFFPCNATAQKLNYELISGESLTQSQDAPIHHKLQKLVDSVGHEKSINILKNANKYIEQFKTNTSEYKDILCFLMAFSWVYRIYKSNHYDSEDKIRIFKTLFELNRKHLHVNDLYARIEQNELLSCFPFLKNQSWRGMKRNVLYLIYKVFPLGISYFKKTKWGKSIKTDTSMIID